jgi:uncharacterized membrane protein
MPITRPCPGSIAQQSDLARQTQTARPVKGLLERRHEVDVALWVVQGLLALVFMGVGLAKLMQSREQLAVRMPALAALPRSAVRTIGTLETLGAIGLIMPALSGVLPWLTPLAAAGLVLLMVSAAIFNLRHRKYPEIIADEVLMALAGFILLGRGGAI